MAGETGSLYVGDIAIALKVMELMERFNLKPTDAHIRLDVDTSLDERKKGYYLTFESTAPDIDFSPSPISAFKIAQFSNLKKHMGCDESKRVRFESGNALMKCLEQKISTAPTLKELKPKAI